MAQCPVCQAAYTEGVVKNCLNCHWDLNPYPLIFQLPEAFVEREKAKLAWAKQMWTRYLEEVEKCRRSQSQLQNLLHQSTLQETTQPKQVESQHQATLQPIIQPQKLQQIPAYQIQQQNLVRVYEFSRELLNISFRNGRWVSGEFGSEVGKFNHPVPQKIQDAVNKGDFRINDNYPPKENEYALLAREIDEYSVLAVATQVKDNKTRTLIAYRYFWLQKPEHSDIDGVGTLLLWWINAREPKFDFEWNPNSSNLNSTTQYYSRENSYKEFERYGHYVQNILSKIKQYPFAFSISESGSRNGLHYLALHLNREYGTPISWAWSVGSLERPEKFTLICSDEKSHQYHSRDIQKHQKPLTKPSIYNHSNIQPHQNPSPKPSEESWHKIRLCLLDIARDHEKLDKNKFEELLSYLEQYSSSTWQWGKIIDQSIKNHANIIGTVYRALLTILGNITISEWLEMPEKGNSPKNQITAIKIQTYLLKISSIRTNDTIYKQLVKRVNLGIIEILLKCQSKIENSTYQNIEWLLSESNSVWTEQFHNYVNNLVVRLVNQDKNGEDQFYQQLVTKLAEREKYQQQFGHYRVLPQYRKLAELFARLGHYSLSAFFYQISYGRVPSDIYDKDDMKIIFTHRDEISSGLTNNTKNRFKLF